MFFNIEGLYKFSYNHVRNFSIFKSLIFRKFSLQEEHFSIYNFLTMRCCVSVWTTPVPNFRNRSICNFPGVGHLIPLRLVHLTGWKPKGFLLNIVMIYGEITELLLEVFVLLCIFSASKLQDT